MSKALPALAPFVPRMLRDDLLTANPKCLSGAIPHTPQNEQSLEEDSKYYTCCRMSSLLRKTVSTTHAARVSFALRLSCAKHGCFFAEGLGHHTFDADIDHAHVLEKQLHNAQYSFASRLSCAKHGCLFVQGPGHHEAWSLAWRALTALS